MKTTVSLPDDLFARADESARRQGISRSRLYAKALSEYLGRRRAAEVTARLNEVLPDEPEGLDPALAMAQSEAIGREEW